MQPPSVARLDGSQAIVMMGTTAELQADLLYADGQGVQAIELVGDVLCLYYVRRKAGFETKSVVSIAPLDYWGMPNYANDINQTWYQLWDGITQSTTLQFLANTILPSGKGVNAWY
jgi:hypothetical protein